MQSKPLLALTAFLAANAASADTLFTKTQNGTVSLIKNLTSHECEISRKKAIGWPVTPEEIKKAKDREAEFVKRAKEWSRTHPCDLGPCELYSEMGDVHHVEPYDIVQAECLQ